MKKTLLTCLAVLVAIATMAVPAKRVWKTVVQSDGTSLTVAFQGDENAHFYATRDNVPVVLSASGDYCYARFNGNTLIPTNVIAHEAESRSASEQSLIVREQTAPRMMAAAQGRKPRRKAAPRKADGQFVGSKKAPVILAYFTDKQFAEDATSIVSFYDKVLNQEGYNENGAPGSVHDYFTDMSLGQFDLTFDIIGPVRVSKSCTYYGGPLVYFGGTDHIGEFITDAVVKADSLYDIDWTQYDWNDDGEVEQVFVLYAGYGQATGGATGTIWPNAWTLDEALQNNDGNGAIDLGNVVVNQYACSNELNGSSGKKKMGIGVFCHEFSHCMGLPDMYDTNYGSTPTMGDWDLLAHGSYNGPSGIGWCPAGWTSYERMVAGWATPVELQAGDVVTGMGDLQDNGESYIIYNDANRNEYYLLENHKQTRWDAYVPESGLLVIHVDYDSLLFANNIVNTRGTFTPDEGYSTYMTNDHARMAPLSRIRSINSETYYYTYPMEGSRFTMDSLTDTSKPAAEVYNAQADGSKLMHKPVYNIQKAANGDISFAFMPDDPTAIDGIKHQEATDESIWRVDGTLVGRWSADSATSLKPGLYIIKGQGTEARKLLVR